MVVLPFNAPDGDYRIHVEREDGSIVPGTSTSATARPDGTATLHLGRFPSGGRYRLVLTPSGKTGGRSYSYEFQRPAIEKGGCHMPGKTNRPRSLIGVVSTLACLALLIQMGQARQVGDQNPPSPPPVAAREKPASKKPKDLLDPIANERGPAAAEARAREMLIAAENEHGADSIEAAETIDAIVGFMVAQDETEGQEPMQ